MSTTKSKKPHCGTKSRQIREYVAKNMDYFREHPVHLAWVMMHYNAIWDNGRIYKQCDDNPKYPIIDLKTKFNLSEEDAGLIYDAWCATMSDMGGNFHDVGLHFDLLLKKHKTYDDWVAIKSNPQNEYSSLWPDQESIDRNLFLTGGCGMSWTPDGYIDYVGPSDVTASSFHGFSRAAPDVRSDIREKIEGLINSPGLERAREWIETGTLRATVTKPVAQALDFFNCGWANQSLDKLPEKRHQEFYDGLTFVCHYEHLMDDIIPRWKDEDWEAASQSDIYDMYGYQLDMSKITLNTCYDARSYVSVGTARSRNLHDDEEDKEFAIKFGLTESEVKELDKEQDERPLVECGYGSLLSDLNYDAEVTEPLDLLEKLKIADALRGWDVVRLHHKKKLERDKRWETTSTEAHSYLDRSYDSPYCRMTNFPDNAHISYVHGCIAYCDRISNSESWTKGDRAAAKKIAADLKKRFNA
jgi:hypothetical protein